MALAAVSVSLLTTACSVTIVGGKDILGDSSSSSLGSLSLRANISAPAHFANHQAASLVLGQKTFNSIDFNRDPSGTAPRNLFGMGSIPGAVAIDSGHLYVMDGGNNRLLFFNSVPVAPMSDYDFGSGGAPEYAIRADWELRSSNPAVWTNFGDPYSVVVSGGKVFIGDRVGGRVLVWNHTFTEAGPPGPPDQVIGQPNFTAHDDDCGTTFRDPKGIIVAGNKLIISDATMNRIYIWNSFPTGTAVSTSSADLILGNSDCSTGASRHEFYGVRQIWSDGVRLVAGDADNNRVLIWNTFPTRSNQDADIVLGDEGGTAGASKVLLANTYGVTSNGTQLFLADKDNCRILIWDQFPTVDHQEPTGILGHDSFTESCGSSASATDMQTMQELFYYNKQLWVGGYDDNRVLMFQGDQQLYNVAEPAVFSNMQGAALVLGQKDFESTEINRGLGLAPLNGMNSIEGAVAVDSGHLYVMDSGNNRMLFFNQVPDASQLGGAGTFSIPASSQFTSPNPGQWDFTFPYGLVVSNGKTLVVDTGNARLLLWNKVFDSTHPITSAPDSIIGQADFAGGGNDCAHNLAGVRFATIAGEKLIVGDFCNRVLIWNQLPTTPFVDVNTADLSLGNPDFSSGTSLHEFNSPHQIWSDGDRLVVGDEQNNRVLIWNHFPTRFNQDADIVLGDPAGASGVSKTLFNDTYSLTSNGTQLFLSDKGNCRILIWNSFPTRSGQEPDQVLGQLDFTSNVCGVTSAYRFDSIQGLYYANRQLWVGGYDGNRVTMFQGVDAADPRFNVSATATFTNNQAASLVLGQKDFNSIGKNRDLTNDINSATAPLTAYSMASINGAIAIDSGHLYVMDGGDNSRFLFFNQVPSGPMSSFIDGGSGEFRIPASAVYQPTGTAWGNIGNPYSIVVAAGRVFVDDNDDHRVLIWNKTFTDADFPLGSPDAVIGQPDLFTFDDNCGSNIGEAKGIIVAGNKLIISDANRNQIYIWNSIPTGTSAMTSSADLVLGNPDCSTGVALNAFSGPRQIWSDGVRLVVGDADNNRVLIWNTFPTTNRAADIVLGNADGTSGTSKTAFSNTYGITSNGTQLFLGDKNNCRVLIWDQFPTSSGQMPTGILGHYSFTEGCGAMNSASARSMNTLQELFYKDKQLWVSGYQDNRLLMFQGQ